MPTHFQRSENDIYPHTPPTSPQTLAWCLWHHRSLRKSLSPAPPPPKADRGSDSVRGQGVYMLHCKTRSRSWKGVAVLGALPHFVRCVCQVPTPFQRSETTTYLHHDLTLHPIYSLLWFPVGKPCLLGVVFLLTYWQKPTNSPYSICFVCQ